MRGCVLPVLAPPVLAGPAAAGPQPPALQTLDYANTRYSELTDIHAGDVGRLKVAWTFPTGGLRGHEGAPPVIGHLMIVHTPFPNVVYRFKTASEIVGDVTTCRHDGRQHVAVLSGVGGWGGIGLAAGLTDPAEGSGAVGGYAALSRYTAAGGQLTVFALPE